MAIKYAIIAQCRQTHITHFNLMAQIQSIFFLFLLPHYLLYLYCIHSEFVNFCYSFIVSRMHEIQKRDCDMWLLEIITIIGNSMFFAIYTVVLLIEFRHTLSRGSMKFTFFLTMTFSNYECSVYSEYKERWQNGWTVMVIVNIVADGLRQRCRHKPK